MGETFEQILTDVVAKGEAAADALNHETQLEDDRAAIKADAVVRIMKRDSIAATPAEKIVETDAAYFEHRAKQRAAVVARFRADAEYKAAEIKARHFALFTPSALAREVELAKAELRIEELERQRNELAGTVANLSAELGETKRELDRARESTEYELREAEERATL